MAEKKHFPEEDALLALTTSLFNQALACADYFEKKCGQPVTPEQFAQIVREFIFLFIHFIDRYSFEMYGHEKRCRITDPLVSLLNKLLQEDHGKFKATDHIGNNITVVRGIDSKMLSERNAQYAKISFGGTIEEAEEASKKCAVAFSSHLSQTIRGIRLDLTYTDLAIDLLSYSLDALNLEEKLAQFKNA
jgi:hypothetical protein